MFQILENVDYPCKVQVTWMVNSPMFSVSLRYEPSVRKSKLSE